MQVPEAIRKCVAFLGFESSTGEKLVAGSVFFVATKLKDSERIVSYAVTARHNIDGIRKKGFVKVWLRLNKAGGDAVWEGTDTNLWVSHPDTTVDIAILACTLTTTYDHLMISQDVFLTDSIVKEWNVGLGDEVFVSGLFRHHYGSQRNIPIVRVGTIACLQEEKVKTKSFGDIDAYLIECRSIGGLSGSPVFVNIGLNRVVGNNPKFTFGTHQHYLLGLIHGHYDTDKNLIDELLEDAEGNRREDSVNTGIAIVVPFSKIFDFVKFEAEKTETI